PSFVGSCTATCATRGESTRRRDSGRTRWRRARTEMCERGSRTKRSGRRGDVSWELVCRRRSSNSRCSRHDVRKI
ncbi:hypothetical protein FRC12_024090, partial [Ceratobasidium sp. 428]